MTRLFALLLFLFVALAVTSSLLIPLGEAPDEVSHFSYADYVSRHAALPPAEGDAYGQVHQPPLYYGLVAGVLFWIPRPELTIQANPDFVLYDPQTPNLLLHPRAETFPYQGNTLAWHLARLLSVAMGAVTVWATWQLARQLLKDEWVALGSAAFVAFLPEFLFISSVVNNDNLVIMLSSLAVLQTIRIVDQNERALNYALLGVLLGLAALAKLSGLVVSVFATIVIGWHVWQQNVIARSALPDEAISYSAQKLTGHTQLEVTFPKAALVILAALVIYAPYGLYNFIRYGDPLGWSFLLADSTLRTTPMTLADFVSNERGLYTSFWGRYGGALQLSPPLWVYLGFTLLALSALVGWLLYARAACTRQLDTRVKRVFVLFVLFWILLLAAHTRWSLNTLGSDQARQLFAGLPLLSIFFTVGFARLLYPRTRVAMTIWSVCFLAASLFLVFTFWTTYQAPIDAASTHTLPAPGATDPVDFGKSIRLLNYQFKPTAAHPGDTVTFSADWQALEPINQNDWLLLQLFKGKEAIVNKDGVPSAGRVTTDLWHTNAIYTSRHTFQIPHDAEPGNYKLTIGIHPAGRYDWLPVKGQDIFPLGTIVVN